MSVEVKDSWWFTDSYGRTVGRGMGKYKNEI